MFAQHYRRFAESKVLHFAAHSHQFWPDVTRDAHMQAWDDAARLVDRKWAQKIFSEVIPAAQAHIARHLEVRAPSRIIFAPNTHELVARLFSCFSNKRRGKVKILTTDGEYHSAMWQMRRWRELPRVSVTRIPVAPFDTFEARFAEAASREKYDMAYFSQVFFASGLAVNLDGIVDSIRHQETMVVADGYHGFMAKPTSLARLQDRIFYLGGGYKYAQAGEGACFTVVPTHSPWDPYDVGWFGMFAHLRERMQFDDPIRFAPDDPTKFWGATFDASGLYRLNAAMQLFADHDMTVPRMDDYVMGLQTYFLDKLPGHHIPWLTQGQLVTPRDLSRAGHFLTFRTEDAPGKERALDERDVLVDSRDGLLRFGFAIYQDQSMIDRLLQIMSEIHG